ncbi:energy-dependent translational throttle protein EttA, partial [Pseudomonas syringae pv. tagetis]
EYAEPYAEFDKLPAEHAKLQSIIQNTADHNLQRQLQVPADALPLPATDANDTLHTGPQKPQEPQNPLQQSAPDMHLH